MELPKRASDVSGTVVGDQKAELTMHSCELCTRDFAGERSLFQHATALHSYNEAEDRAGTDGYNPVNSRGPVTIASYLTVTAPWQDGERRRVVVQDRVTGTKILKDYEVLYAESQEGEKVAEVASKIHATQHGSSTSVSGLSCGSCERSFLSVRGLSDHASAVHGDQALEATYNERQELVSKALRAAINSGSSYTRLYSYVIDMTDEVVIFQVEGQEHYHQATYSIDDDGVVTLGDHVMVRRRTLYEPIGATS